MALSVNMTRALAAILKPGMDVASMGYPDLIAPMSELKALGADFSGLKFREDSQAICKRHGLHPCAIPDAHSMFGILGCDLDVYDIVCERGCEHLCDLNYPWESLGTGGTQKKYDIVLDVGTSEHVMNIGQALVTMAALVKPDGFILHENPHSGWHNHGFYSLHPTLFHDFYSGNGFEVMKCVLATRDWQEVEVPATARFNTQGETELNMLCVARRAKNVPFQYQTQTKYNRP